MRLSRHPSQLPPGTAACIGAFDGLHLGHQALLRRARELAPRLALITFEPHPAQILAPDRAPPRLQTPGQRARVAAALGVDDLVVLPFDRALADTAPGRFVDDLLLRGLRPAALVVGPDFRFGAGRGGGPEDLARALAAAGVPFALADEVFTPADLSHVPGKISSSGIRRALEGGDLDAAARLLGRPASVEGQVVPGARRGRTLGFPTANVAPSAPLLLPSGVYAGALGVAAPGPLRGRLWPAVMNLGTSPTFDPAARASVLEVHALGAELGADDLYGLTVEVAFAARLRPELRFAGATELAAQIARDVELARPLLPPAWLDRAILGLSATWDEDHV